MMMECIIALSLLFSGLLGFEGLELMMKHHERQVLTEIKVARQRHWATIVGQDHA